ncbi:MAG: ATP-binding protein [Candidatus Loosdrechtia sp.]|uniref:ATP-binding protein n=1 Tax=Candidatus Loosdrechtia sp. TaxID=3101272 RepID=UPI003A6E9954|nr:MAG: ATP-binding protein [Candidatus Jettenia sp. AMX2]
MLPDIFKNRVEDILCNVITTLEAGVSIVDKNLIIVWSNELLAHILHLKENPLGKSCREVYACECPGTENCTILQALSHGERRISSTQLITEKGERRYIQNFSIPVKNEKGDISNLLKLSIDITEKEEKIRQISLLRKLSELMHGTLQIDRLLHLILTCVTAGVALGFNRARLFLVDKEKNIVYGKMAVGPSNQEEASKIWSEIANKYEELEDLIKASEDNYRDDTPLHLITRLMAYPLDEEGIVISCIKNKMPVLIKDAVNSPNIDKKFLNMIEANEFVCVPLLVKEEAIGLICADNFYSRNPITEEHVQLLCTFASQAALAIENAEAYKKLGEKIQQLKETQERLICSERLGVIGNMAAYVAHEIRNPLVTIGGFARAILRTSHPDDQIKQGIEIIVEEVNRLEKILKNIMDFSKPHELVKTDSQINEIVENICSLMEPYFKNSNIQLMRKFSASIPKIIIDTTQIKQVFLNIIKNAVESMPKGGTLTIETAVEDNYVKINIADTGEGMSAEIIRNIFVPFFTTKADGTGVGLAVSQKILDEHGGCIRVKSLLKQGSTFSIYLPIIK